ncbi:phosphopantetheine-binding protein [Saccharopolyspora shandongensis]|uniref:Phosphopantetheine attachment site n=1 Tax=Saccharopolyspora shandongensis TaxID=418495 RepID=A0A1H3HSX9_9PSEU|nr:phosphopantetheine-binding protein [Saccharopolyspora shandongensis]SDY18577.1 Phosphopantetheine attachment site [Saccharopolyspora shandongensis]
MTAEQQTDSAAEEVLRSYLTDRLKADVLVDQDLFASGLVNSMFAMELVVYLEKTFEVAIIGEHLRLDNFRTIQSMAALVRTLRDGSDG